MAGHLNKGLRVDSEKGTGLLGSKERFKGRMSQGWSGHVSTLPFGSQRAKAQQLSSQGRTGIGQGGPETAVPEMRKMS
jgi:hypothetical protein